jgi:hypothetical protein
MADTVIPQVCFASDLCRILSMSGRQLRRLRRARAFPIPELPALDRRPRWSGLEVRKFIEGQSGPVARRWRA